jgi:hypothetical protein
VGRGILGARRLESIVGTWPAWSFKGFDSSSLVNPHSMPWLLAGHCVSASAIWTEEGSPPFAEVLRTGRPNPRRRSEDRAQRREMAHPLYTEDMIVW